MITLNLLPDIKKEYLKTNRNRRIIVVLAAVFSAGLLALVASGLIYTKLVRGPHAEAQQEDITAAVAQIKETEDLDKILTVNSQLQQLPALHEQKPLSSRLLQYLLVLTPDAVSINELTINFSDEEVIDGVSNRFTMSGLAEEVADINILADTLKNATYVIDKESESARAFTQVAVPTYGAVSDDGGTDIGIAFTVQAQYDPAIFAATNTELKLTVPNITSSKANQETPSLLFDTQEGDE